MNSTVKSLHLLVSLSLSSSPLVFGQEVQAPPEAQQSGAQQSGTPAAISAAAISAPSAILVDGTPIKLRLVNKLDSRKSKDEDPIAFDVVNDVVLSGVVVLRRGDPASAVVVQSVSSKTMGRAGRLNFTVNDIKLRDGSTVKVRAFNNGRGDGRTAEMVGYMLTMPMVAAPFFLLMHGEDTTFPRGTEINAFVNGDRRLDLSAFGAIPGGQAK
jgi:hypothetical protein